MKHAVTQLMYSPHSISKQALLFTLAVALCMLLPEILYANPSNAMASTLCAVVSIVYGNFGRAIATLAVIAIGVGAMLGKVSWGLALTVAGGMAVVFNASGIVVWLTSGTAC